MTKINLPTFIPFCYDEAPDKSISVWWLAWAETDGSRMVTQFIRHNLIDGGAGDMMVVTHNLSKQDTPRKETVCSVEGAKAYWGLLLAQRTTFRIVQAQFGTLWAQYSEERR